MNEDKIIKECLNDYCPYCEGKYNNNWSCIKPEWHKKMSLKKAISKTKQEMIKEFEKIIDNLKMFNKYSIRYGSTEVSVKEIKQELKQKIGERK